MQHAWVLSHTNVHRGRVSVFAVASHRDHRPRGHVGGAGGGEEKGVGREPATKPPAVESTQRRNERIGAILVVRFGFSRGACGCSAV